MAFPGVSQPRRSPPAGALDRIALLAERLLDASASAIVAGSKTRSCTAWHAEPALSALADAVGARIESAPSLWFRDLWQDATLRRVDGEFRFLAVTRIDGSNGEPLGVLIVAGPEPRSSSLRALRHLSDLASLAANEFEAESRLARYKEHPGNRHTREQLLDKTLELTKFSEDLRQIHRLSTTQYTAVEEMFADYLETGRGIFGLASGAILCDGAVVAGRRTEALPDGVASQVERHRQTLTGDGTGSRPSYIAAAIVVDDEVWGVLSFGSPHRRWREFSSHEIELMELMAKSMGRSLLERRMLAARRRAESLERDRSQALEMVAKNRPLAEVLAKIAAMVERQCPAVEARLAEGAADVPAAAIVPIVAGDGERLGTLSVTWRAGTACRELEPDVLEMAAQLAAIAMEHRRLTGRLEFQAQHDVLTGLPNRAVFTAELQRAMEAGRAVCVVFLDLDRFKQINDHWGHAIGDLVLRETARRICACLKPGESASRLGGDEFVATISAGGDADAMERSERILNAVRAPIAFDGQTLTVTASAGVSLYPQSLPADATRSAEALLAGADQAMYHVKKNGRNGARLSSSESSDARATSLQLEYSLGRALREGEFRLYFQPVFDVREGSGIAFEEMEVLLGWDHPRLGRIEPGRFIPIAEQCGMIAEIGEWVLRTACRQSAEWRASGLPAVRLAVNVSPLQFEAEGFVELVEAALEENSLPGEALELELTEGAILKDMPAAAAKLERLRKLGVHLTLDDFGTGYSALSFLRSLPVDTLKIDRSFVAETVASAHTRTLVEAIIAMAHSMGLTVVAEGVETEAQFQLLVKQRCDYIQGHLLSAPLTAVEARRWLTQQTAPVR